MSVIFGLFLLVAQAIAGPGTVAVMYFQNQGNPELEPLKVGLAQMLTTDLVGAGGAKIVERTQLQAVMDELKLGHSPMVDKDTAAKVGKLLGAEYVVLGSYFELAGTLRVDARMVRVETGEIVHAQGANGKVADFLELERAVATSFREAVARVIPGALAALPPVAAAVGARPLEAAMALSDGLIALDQKELPRARESFQKAIAADPRLEAAREQLAGMDL
ncbi:MAG: CsgG/HfaB family protein [Myxococcota bacterium]